METLDIWTFTGNIEKILMVMMKTKKQLKGKVEAIKNYKCLVWDLDKETWGGGG